MNKPKIRAQFKSYRSQCKKLNTTIYNIEMRHLKDISQLDTRIGELEIERDYYKRRNGRRY